MSDLSDQTAGPPAAEHPGEGRGLFGAILWRGPVFEATADAAWLQAMLDAEAALAWAQADIGLLRPEAARLIEGQCRAERFGPEGIAALGRAAASGGNPVIPLVQALVAAVETSEAGVTAREAGAAVHRGATSQDIIDTAAMIVSRHALLAIEATWAAAAGRGAALAVEHRGLVMAGRTLAQQAAPISFGFKAAGWLVGLVSARRQLETVRAYVLAAQLGGAVGTLSAYGEHAASLLGAFARRLDLVEPVMAWHTERTRMAQLAGALAATAGVVNKVATDLVLLSQTEVGEVHDRAEGRGGSSAMPHKRNPIAAISARACAMTVPGCVVTLFSAMGHEHERAAGAWHAEWRALSEGLRSVGSAAAWLEDALDQVDVEPAAMAANLQRTHGLLQAEAVAAALTPVLGRAAAHAQVEQAARSALTRNIPFGMVLAEQPSIGGVLDPAILQGLVDPAAGMGAADVFIDRALADHQRA